MCIHIPLRSQFGGFALGDSAQLKLSPTRRIELGSTVFGFTSLLKSGKCSRIWAAVLIRLPVTTTRAPNTSAFFRGADDAVIRQSAQGGPIDDIGRSVVQSENDLGVRVLEFDPFDSPLDRDAFALIVKYGWL